MGLKILGRVGTQFFFYFFFFWKKIYDFMHFEMHKMIFFPVNLSNSRFHQ